MAIGATRHCHPAPPGSWVRGRGGGDHIGYMMNTGHKKLATLGFLRCSSPNWPAPNIETLRARSYLPISRWDRTTPSNKGPHIPAAVQAHTHAMEEEALPAMPSCARPVTSVALSLAMATASHAQSCRVVHA